eukprot:scaffold159918_cov26-Prasinocladus_malaysianus.AAC.2
MPVQTSHVLNQWDSRVVYVCVKTLNYIIDTRPSQHHASPYDRIASTLHPSTYTDWKTCRFEDSFFANNFYRPATLIVFCDHAVGLAK